MSPLCSADCPEVLEAEVERMAGAGIGRDEPAEIVHPALVETPDRGSGRPALTSQARERHGAVSGADVDAVVLRAANLLSAEADHGRDHRSRDRKGESLHARRGGIVRPRRAGLRHCEAQPQERSPMVHPAVARRAVGHLRDASRDAQGGPDRRQRDGAAPSSAITKNDPSIPAGLSPEIEPFIGWSGTPSPPTPPSGTTTHSSRHCPRTHAQ